MTHKNRPKNLNLLTIRLPLPALVSILHRISGIFLFLLLPLLLWMLAQSLEGSASFEALATCINTCAIIRLLIWFTLSMLAYHVVAGVRHLIMDMGICESLACGRKTSGGVLIISAVIIIMLGVWLW